VRTALTVALVGTSLGPASGIEPPKDWDAAVQPEEMMRSLAKVARAFGPDAVIFQTALLNEAVRNGSILEAKVEKPELERREGRSYVAFTLESGIVYNDNDVSAEERVWRTWREIVAAALRRVAAVKLDAEGLAVNVGYHHRPYADERQLRAELPDGRGEAERMSYYLRLEDADKLARGAADPEEVLRRTLVLRGGQVLELR
jgi:hypothetical protein